MLSSCFSHAMCFITAVIYVKAHTILKPCYICLHNTLCMINKMVSKLCLPRFIEFILGVFLVILVVLRYSSPQVQNKFVLSYLVPNPYLFVLVTIFLILVAARLLAGKPNHYAPFFRKLLQKFSAQKHQNQK